MKKFSSFFLLLSILIILPHFVLAQTSHTENLPKYDRKPYHFGFLLSGNTMDFFVKSIKDFNNYDSLYVVESSPRFGFNIGILADLTLTKHLNLRFTPTLSFGERNIQYTIKIQDTIFFNALKSVESTYLDFPLLFKFKSARLTNFRAYVLFGAKYSFDLASLAKKKDQRADEIFVKIKPHDLSGIIGVGVDFYTLYFKFAIELQFSYGFLNLIKRENNIFTNSLESLNSKIFQLNFTFE